MGREFASLAVFLVSGRDVSQNFAKTTLSKTVTNEESVKKFVRELAKGCEVSIMRTSRGAGWLAGKLADEFCEDL